MALATGETQAVTADRAVMAWVRLGVISAAVLAMLALAAFVFAPRLRGGEGTRVKAAGASMRTIATSLQGFRAESGRYPAGLQELVTARYLEKVPLDSWKRPFVYAVPGPADKPFALISTGPDGVQGTADDVNWWSVEQE